MTPRPITYDTGYDSVRLSGFTEPTAKWLAELADVLWGAPPPYVSLEQAAALFFILRSRPDEEFPGGKWATIQHLEGLIEKAVAEAS